MALFNTTTPMHAFKPCKMSKGLKLEAGKYVSINNFDLDSPQH